MPGYTKFKTPSSFPSVTVRVCPALSSRKSIAVAPALPMTKKIDRIKIIKIADNFFTNPPFLKNETYYYLTRCDSV